MKGSTRQKSRIRTSATHSRSSRRNHALLPALVAAGSAATLAATPASALELGQIQVQSTLGQPLRASIAYALNPTEELYDFCVFLNKGVATDGLPVLTTARITVTPEQILLSGAVPLKEPMLSMRLTVDCPYTANLSREYMLMINPPDVADAVATSDTAAAPQTPAVQSNPVVAAIPERAVVAKVADQSPVQKGSEYRVQIGDSVSGIVSRIENRSFSLWPAVDAIYQANSHAFFNNDVNQLKAGSMLFIPDFSASGAAPTTIAETPVATVEENASEESFTSAYSGYEETAEFNETFDTGYAVDAAAVTTENAFEFEDTAPAQIEESVADDDTAVLGSGDVVNDNVAQLPTETAPADRVSVAQPGDVFVGSEIPTDASIEGQESLVPVPVVSTTQSTTDSGNGAWTWLIWLAGTGVAIIAGLLLFGRRLRGRFGGDSAPAVDPALSRRASDNPDTQTNEALADVDFQFDDAGFDDAVMGEQSMQLDADLGAGTGLQEGSDMDVAQDFGFSATDEHAALDMEFPDSDTQEEERPETDIIPPQKIARETILDSEVPPDSDDDGEYDLSMIVDATKQALGDTEGTAKDLMAVQLAAEPATDGTDYTLNKDVDYQVLEQDYEDEMTATQALNMDIEKAAMELVARMGDNADSETADVPALETDVTAEMPVASADNELTAEMPISTADSEPTAEMPISSADSELTAEMQLATTDDENELTSSLESPKDPDMTAELTAELPTNTIAENEDFISDLDDTGVNEELTANMDLPGDETVEMDVEGGTLDTKKIAG